MAASDVAVDVSETEQGTHCRICGEDFEDHEELRRHLKEVGLVD